MLTISTQFKVDTAVTDHLFLGLVGLASELEGEGQSIESCLTPSFQPAAGRLAIGAESQENEKGVRL
jgi:hypothetical protein